MSQEQWYMAFDRKSGNPYYYNNRGDTTFERPMGFAAPQQQPTKRPSFMGFGGMQSVRLSPQQQRGPGSQLSAPGSGMSNMSGGPPQGRGGGGPPSSFSNPGSKVAPSLPAPSNVPIGQKMGTPLRVLYPHVARYEDELTLRPGQIVIGLEKVEGGTWWYGELNGMRGHFPANFVEVVQEERRPEQPMQQRNPPPQQQNYGASSPGWFQQDVAPQRPPKPDAIAMGNQPRDFKAQLKDEQRVQQGSGGRSTLKFTFWAHTWGYSFAMFAVVLGAFGFLWYTEAVDEPLNSTKRQKLGSDNFWVGPATAGAGVLAFAMEYKIGLKRTDEQYQMFGNLPFRGIFYLLASVPCFFSYPTILAGVIGLGAAGVNYFSETKNERGTSPPKVYIFRFSSEIFKSWTFTMTAIMVGFIGINAFLFLGRYFLVEQARQQCIIDLGGGDPNTKACITMWAPFAKGFGTTLDFTCALIVVPVMRAFIKKISTIEVSPNKTLATVLPLKKNIQFHKMIAFSIFIGSAGHIAAHFLNFAFNPDAAIAGFGAPALYTGGVITLFMNVIFVAAHDSVRRSSFEAFWWSHHSFLIVFPFLLAHGPKYWYFAVLPIPMYAFDRLVRARRGTNPMLVDYVRYSPPVLKLHFFPERIEDFVFREGQYLYIQCPHINDYEWHPFTISSSFGDLEKFGYVSLHIRVQSKGSWTWQLMEYFKLLSGKGGSPPITGPDGKKQDPPFESHLTHFDSTGVVQRGKLFGPDGKPLIRIDGPHAAPAQTYSVYRDVMLVGSGIGLTPSAAILSAVTRHKWKKGFQPETLRFFWVARHSEIDSFEWFIELLDDISRKVVADRKAGSISPYHRLEINIYITSAPSNINIRQVEKAAPAMRNKVEEKRKEANAVIEAGMLDQYLGFNMDDIKTLIKNPTVSSKEQGNIQYSSYGYYNKLPNRLGYIYVYNGRPQWDQIFAAVREGRHRGIQEVGVCYCGAPNIGNDLKENCTRFTGYDCTFTLNKEVF